VSHRGETYNGGQYTRPDADRCEHNHHVLAINTDTGYCYARCLRCLFTGPERRSGEAARLALRVLGLRSKANLRA
jgi:hypothetical protein